LRLGAKPPRRVGGGDLTEVPIAHSLRLLGVAERGADDPLLDDLGDLVRHRPTPALARAQHLEPRVLDLRLPAVVGRAVDAERPAGVGDRRAGGELEELQA
jgi:hypothetical protein